MSNMSYCRFQNTAGDLADCVAALEEGDRLSDDELRAAVRLVRMCRQVAEMYDHCTDDRDSVRAAIAGNFVSEEDENERHQR